jgi:2-(3-amino-3-carboxypropyl)histidine synthase
MELSGYSINIEDAATVIKNQGHKTVAIQIPEGLKRDVFPLVEYLEKETGSLILVCADPCYGACDVVNYELKNMDVDFVIHIGHTEIPEVENYWIPTMFINAFSTLNVTAVVEKAVPQLIGKRIGIVTTAQHLLMLDTAEAILKKHDLQPIIPQGVDRTSERGQILGCNFSAATSIMEDVDSFLFIGSGMFHPVGLLLSTRKPVIAADPYVNTVKKQELDDLKNNMLRQRYGAIVAARSAKKFGVLLGVKRGQQRLKIALEARKMLESAGKKSIFITMNEFSNNQLQGFGDLDCYVSTACPRIAIDDYHLYKKPIITPVELEIVLGRREWEQYMFDQIPE